MRQPDAKRAPRAGALESNARGGAGDPSVTASATISSPTYTWRNFPTSGEDYAREDRLIRWSVEIVTARHRISGRA